MINAKLVKTSYNLKTKNYLFTYVVTFPRIILPEVLTHRAFSRNTSSSRAIPLSKMVEVIKEKPFVPYLWQKAHKGMQGNDYIIDKTSIKARSYSWLKARNYAVRYAQDLGMEFLDIGQQDNEPVTKQLCNRLLEPFMWVTMAITTSESGLRNFFDLRCPKYYWGDTNTKYKSWNELCEDMKKDGANEEVMCELINTPLVERFKNNLSQAEVHIQLLAEEMYNEYLKKEELREELKENEYHIPFITKEEKYSRTKQDLFVLSVARAARVSYTAIEDDHQNINFETALAIYDKCFKNKHSSVFEHIAKTTNNPYCYNNLYGFIPLRYILGL